MLFFLIFLHFVSHILVFVLLPKDLNPPTTKVTMKVLRDLLDIFLTRVFVNSDGHKQNTIDWVAFKQQKVILSQLWRPGVHDQDVSIFRLWCEPFLD